MSDEITATATQLFNLLPARIRLLDAAQGGALFALMRVLASGAVEVDAEIDQLSDGAFVETAGPAGSAALARLVDAPLLSPTPDNPTGTNRAFIANTVRRRRAKGTPRALEGVATDVVNAGAVVVEYFQHLARLVHLVDVRPDRPALAVLDDGDIRARLGTPFDLTPRLASVGSIARSGERYGIGAVGVHVARLIAPQFPAPAGTGLTAAKLAAVPPLLPWLDGGAVVPGYFQLAARTGGIQALANPDRRAEGARTRVVETELVARLRRLPLHRDVAARRWRLARNPPGPSVTQWFDSDGQPFALFLRRAGATAFDRVPPERLTIVNLTKMPDKVAGVRPRPGATATLTWNDPAAKPAGPQTAKLPIDAAIDPVTGRLVIADPGGRADVVEARLAHAYAQPGAIGAGPERRDDASVPLDVAKTDFLRVVDPVLAGSSPEFVATFADALAAWKADSTPIRGFIVLAYCDVDVAVASPVVAIKPGTELHIVAAQWRPSRLNVPAVREDPRRAGYLVREERRYTLPVGLAITPAGPPPTGGRPGALVLDGLSISGPVKVDNGAVSVLRIRWCTLRPSVPVPQAPVAALAIAGPLSTAAISIEHSLTHTLALEGAAAIDGSITIDASVVTADGAADGIALSASGLDAAITDTTILGGARVKSLEATNLIVTGLLVATRRQAGCVRYSYLGLSSQTPRRFRCQPDLAVAERLAATGQTTLSATEDATVRLGAAPVFLDTDLDQPTAAMLSVRCPDAIRRGGEAGTEMGAFAHGGQPILLANIAALFNEDLPAALEGAVLDDTRSSAANAWRTLP